MCNFIRGAEGKDYSSSARQPTRGSASANRDRRKGKGRIGLVQLNSENGGHKGKLRKPACHQKQNEERFEEGKEKEEGGQGSTKPSEASLKGPPSNPYRSKGGEERSTKERKEERSVGEGP